MEINDDPMVVSKFVPMHYIPVWEPNYGRKTAMIDVKKVGDHNKIVFPKAPSLPGTYYLSGKTIRKYNKVSNGTIMCYDVPVKELRPLTQLNREEY